MNPNPPNPRSDNEVRDCEDPSSAGVFSYDAVLRENEAARKRALDYNDLLERYGSVIISERGILLPQATTTPNIDELSGAQNVYRGGPEEVAVNWLGSGDRSRKEQCFGLGLSCRSHDAAIRRFREALGQQVAAEKKARRDLFKRRLHNLKYLIFRLLPFLR